MFVEPIEELQLVPGCQSVEHQVAGLLADPAGGRVRCSMRRCRFSRESGTISCFILWSG
jgi:hypothetical protein